MKWAKRIKRTQVSSKRIKKTCHAKPVGYLRVLFVVDHKHGSEVLSRRYHSRLFLDVPPNGSRVREVH